MNTRKGRGLLTDSEFKKLNFADKNGEAINILNNNLGDYYKPDIVLGLSNGELAILEHSSTGDRKVHIGELLQAFQYAFSSGKKVHWLLFLDGKGQNSPTVTYEKCRLNFYLDFLRCNSPKNDKASFTFDVFDLEGELKDSTICVRTTQY